MVTESLTETLEADEESVLSGNEINEPDFFSSVPISAAGSIDIVGTLDDATPEGQFPLHGDFTKTPPIDSDSEPKTNPNSVYFVHKSRVDPTSYPGSFLYAKERPWLGLVT